MNYGTFERRLRQEGHRLLAGIDEAGRGPLAGPVVAAACILSEGAWWEGIQDSKALSPAERKDLFWVIASHALVGVGTASEEEIDRLNILKASLLAMQRAVLALSATPDLLLIDGPYPIDLPIHQAPVIRGDEQLVSVGAASIVAKVVRDEMMAVYDLQYPRYGFREHKGYPTKAHLAALEEHGPSPIHRMSFRPVQRLVVG